jgi:hypothetical protein
VKGKGTMTAKKAYKCKQGKGKKEKKKKKDGQNMNLEDFSTIIIFNYLYRNYTKFCSSFFLWFLNYSFHSNRHLVINVKWTFLQVIIHSHATFTFTSPSLRLGPIHIFGIYIYAHFTYLHFFTTLSLKSIFMLREKERGDIQISILSFTFCHKRWDDANTSYINFKL